MKSGSLVIALWIFFAACSAWAADLPRLAIDPDSVTVSGVSSGAFMAAQFHIAHSALVKGAGLVAGGLYACAVDKATGDSIEASVSRALGPCMADWPALEAADRFADFARHIAAQGWIDPLENLAGSPVYLFSGRADETVATAAVLRAGDFYERFQARVTLLDGLPPSSAGPEQQAGHAWIIAEKPDFAGPCAETTPPFINACGYDQAGEILASLYGDLQPRMPSEELTGRILTFQQRAFVQAIRPRDIGLWDDGYLYVPANCEPGASPQPCRLHVAFHGCEQSAEIVGDQFYAGVGLNEWADANRIVVLYPQTTRISLLAGWLEANPYACWNWWGYADDDRFLTRDGDQIKAVKAMIDLVMGAQK